jgi:streptomycin 6-kinase
VADARLEITAWRETVDGVVTECAEQWGLRIGVPYAPGVPSHVVRVELPGGAPAVLKVFWPHREAEHEADALERWAGDGAVQLIARDDVRHAMLLERCEPGAALSGSPDALDVLIGLLPRLWKSADGFHTIEEEAEIWTDDIAREVSDAALRDAALAYLRELVPTQGERVLVNQDLHGDNVLSAQREPWLVIDPKPVAAERELSVAPIVRSDELGDSRRDVLYRLDRLTAELGLDRERARGWTIAQTVAWSGGSDYIETHLQTARWLLEDA